jgi:hypothetical protein
LVQLFAFRFSLFSCPSALPPPHFSFFIFHSSLCLSPFRFDGTLLPQSRAALRVTLSRDLPRLFPQAWSSHLHFSFIIYHLSLSFQLALKHFMRYA